MHADACGARAGCAAVCLLCKQTATAALQRRVFAGATVAGLVALAASLPTLDQLYVLAGSNIQSII